MGIEPRNLRAVKGRNSTSMSTDATLPVSPSDDPFASLDPYDRLDSSQLHNHWSHDDDASDAFGAARSLAERLGALASGFNETTYVDVRLVGFDGDGYLELNLADADLQRVLDAAPSWAPQRVVHPPEGAPHALPVRRRFVYTVSRAAPGLAAKIAAATKGAAEASGGAVPVAAVDDLVRADYVEQRLSHATLYLLNPAAPRKLAHESEEHAQLLQAAGHARDGGGPLPTWWVTTKYWYTDDGAGDGAGAGGGCGVTKWVGRDRRYAWVDLTAGPLAYGAATAGDGIVTEHTMPRVHRFRLALQSHAIDAMQELSVELGALALQSARTLLAPPLWYLPRRSYSTIRLLVLQIDQSSPTTRSGVTRLDVGAIRREVEALALPGQRVELSVVHTSFAECAECVAAYAAAVKSHSSAVRTPDGGGGGGEGVAGDALRTEVHSYLDSAELHRWLSTQGVLRRFFDHEAVHGGDRGGAAADELVVPAVVYALDVPHLLLLDRFHQAVAFPDAVVAVQTRAGAATIDARCGGAALEVATDSIERPLLGALLQVGWGVAPSDTLWSEGRGAAESSLLWHVGHTPFGPYSKRPSLSFALRDAAARAALHARASEALLEAHDLQHYFGEYNLQVDDVLGADAHLRFLRRLNLLSYKLGRAATYLQLHNFGHANHYLHSTHHDLVAMRAVLDGAGAALRTHLHCPGDGGTAGGGWWMAAAAALAAAGAAWWRRGGRRGAAKRVKVN